MEDNTAALVGLLEQIARKLDTLESIDKSIDFLASAMTGMDPLDIEFGQKALGRLARAHARELAAPEPPEVDEGVAIDPALLEEIIEEEIKKLLTPSGKEN